MKNSIFKILGLALAISLSTFGGELRAQGIESISFSLFSESIAFPFSRLAPIHPGAEIGIQLSKDERSASIRSWNAYVGGYYHEKVELGFYLRAEYQHTFRLGKDIGLDFPMGLGYLHTFYPGEIYELDVENGDFDKQTQLGRPHALVNVGIGLSFNRSGDFQPFIKHELGIETPFITSIPVVPHSFTKVGFNLKIK
ncbi:MAG: hypothetical protein AAFO07_13140 [Bacteroidota bacterium]